VQQRGTQGQGSDIAGWPATSDRRKEKGLGLSSVTKLKNIWELSETSAKTSRAVFALPEVGGTSKKKKRIKKEKQALVKPRRKKQDTGGGPTPKEPDSGDRSQKVIPQKRSKGTR